MKNVKILLKGEYIGSTTMSIAEMRKAENAGFTIIVKK